MNLKATADMIYRLAPWLNTADVLEYLEDMGVDLDAPLTAQPLAQILHDDAPSFFEWKLAKKAAEGGYPVSWARFADDSDVYVFENTGGYIECCGCSLMTPDPMVDTVEEMLAHLQEHIRAGHKVPVHLRSKDAFKDWLEEP